MEVKVIQLIFLFIALFWSYYLYVFVTDTSGRLFIFNTNVQVYSERMKNLNIHHPNTNID